MGVGPNLLSIFNPSSSQYFSQSKINNPNIQRINLAFALSFIHQHYILQLYIPMHYIQSMQIY